MYKIFSGILSQRITSLASALGWLSPEQKRFLPGVRGVQEHTAVLQTVVETAKAGKRDLGVAWLDLANAFGSIPHGVLSELFSSLPLPPTVKKLVRDIYTRNELDFVLKRERITIFPTSGVRQGDALSCKIFNLAAEPLLRAAKSPVNPGFLAYGCFVKATAYADDIAVMTESADDLQLVLDDLSTTAGYLGLKFNARKCTCLALKKGCSAEVQVSINANTIRCLGPNEQESFLGVPIGSKLRFRVPTSVVGLMDKVLTSLLAPWQKMEVLRSHLLPSLSNEQGSGRVLKETLTLLDNECAKNFRSIFHLPDSSTTPYFYADRKVGALGLTSLSEDADIWTIARAAQLLTSSDPTVSTISWCQLHKTIRSGLRITGKENLPVKEFLSGSIDEGGVYRLRYGSNPTTNLWSLTRKAAMRLKVQFDVSGDQSIRLIADNIAVLPLKAIKGLRLAVRQRWTKELASKPHQGRVASGLVLDPSKDNSRVRAGNGGLSIIEWQLLHRCRLDLLPLRGYPWSIGDNKSCPRCFEGTETAVHITNHCKMGLQLSTKRHNSVLDLLSSLMVSNRWQQRSTMQNQTLFCDQT